MQAPGLYVHVPFCKKRCIYCAFCSGIELGLMDDWLDALRIEVEGAGSFGRPFDSLHLGGGTPSLLGAARLERLMEILSILPLSEDCERAIEANPDDIDRDLLQSLRALGFNRLSVGVQSLNDERLRFLGRRHDAASALMAIKLAKEAGFPKVGLDLMYALPGQRLPEWRQELREALELGIDHLSAYELTVEDSTPLGRMVRARQCRLQGEAARRRFFLATARLLGEAGWWHYEVSNHARTPEHASRHNQKYWSHAPYLGLGPGAHSYDGEHRRWWNTASTRAYIERLQEGRGPVEEEEELDAEALRLERLALGFRRAEGVSLEDLAGRERELLRHVREGRLVVGEGRARPTTEGMLWADALAREFFLPE